VIMMPFGKELAIAEEAVRIAAKLCQAVRDPNAMEKNDKSPVTVADYGSQAIICKFLLTNFPEDPVVAEEDANELEGDPLNKVTNHVKQSIGDDSITPDDVTKWINHGNGTTNTGRFWTLDPIDGTKGFLRGDQYAIALALVEDGEVKLGILGCPALKLESFAASGCLFTAVLGQGTFLKPLLGNGSCQISRLQVAQNDDHGGLRFVESVEVDHGNHKTQEHIAKAVGITRDSLRMDSQVKYGIVATGEAALYLRLPSEKKPNYRECIWDHAAGSIVVEEAGGKVTDMLGKPLDFCSASKMNDNQGVVVSNGFIHKKVMNALQDLENF